ncbi:unnamed protein product [Dracunculus medinensis]|uniref:Transthyretin-like family protein n=1 Tax=Dracunculus medinensis TaxID=318479 RepID=A0A0N4U522_DRAME|nr:unnamed protein product [Dracunculus medinensis]
MMKGQALGLLVIFNCILSLATAFRSQSVWATGKLLCGTKPASSVYVKLVDKDRAPNPDDLLDSSNTNATGHFNLMGDSIEMSDIDPEIRIYHDCNDYNKPCQREWIIRIPDKYIFDGDIPQKPFDFGVLNLEVELENEYKKCT